MVITFDSQQGKSKIIILKQFFICQDKDLWDIL
jgi:hypothetical protein